jgi:hypothetical protein
MAYIHDGKSYQSKKHPVLEYIFQKYNPGRDVSKREIHFTLADISEGYSFVGIKEPSSISNTILDLTRKASKISSRLPESIYGLGYDLEKKTGAAPNGESYAGTFIFVGVGNEIQSWLEWPEEMQKIPISSTDIPSDIFTTS